MLLNNTKDSPPQQKIIWLNISILLRSRNPSTDKRHLLGKSDHIPHKYDNVKMAGVIPKKIPFKEPFEKMHPFREKKLMTVRFPAGLDTIPMFTESLWMLYICKIGNNRLF